MNGTRTQPCPHCRKSAPWEGNPWRPFCSERCRVIDLGNWAAESYRIPGEPLPDEANQEHQMPCEDDKEKT